MRRSRCAGPDSDAFLKKRIRSLATGSITNSVTLAPRASPRGMPCPQAIRRGADVAAQCSATGTQIGLRMKRGSMQRISSHPQGRTLETLS